MFEIGYKQDEIVLHENLCKRAKCGCMGGIRYSKDNNVLLLFMKKDSDYCNVWNGEVLEFMGSGKGNQSIELGLNRRLADSEKKDTAVCLFEWVDSMSLKFVGRMILSQEPIIKKFNNKYGNAEDKVVFYLERAKK